TRELHKKGRPTARELAETALAILRQDAPEARVDYLEVVDRDTLAPIEPDSPVPDHALVATAVFLGRTRLIDNIELDR
ncbi:MAG: pantoate--beta-alanine ligase, partial [Actinobacteria bacterium]|nr:pantoate--beta-alanine ligase [Actinomycetota bacterium]NIS33850.1 pantoate--beta-alanine ligase [Actinomycetota bacterium]NIU20787.1 pantoate--beta-alanine ligase [Actinomycetota bacterium]NIU68670.1 pantoate--beta-alanine ligase [Actinomycetota bacterium]NIW30515.1 pantoate--beta-alanine ligase [Actinomycetota bacterium]